ncbi:ABC transporter permease [Oceanobacter mangrovi]|uniref:ABC transporter permease n=1 Tax=Oceanobacter mangrovi TaxID=2862510 RepID=UPI001C8D7884|nr:ABC transporter permease [Oceanobacter mangrovi]
MNRNLTWFGITALTFGLAFMYLPILVLVIYSFNDSEMVTLWSHPSLRWYQALFNNGTYWGPAWTTLRIALVSSVLATILGIMISLVVTRMRKFRGRSLFIGMTIAPLVLPEVITGLALLLLFIAMGVERGFLTVIIAHTTFSMCFVSVIVTARMAEFDIATEEAARDLGCGPVMAFFHATLPAILPAVISAFLLAFALSLDNLVVTTFTTGPGITTLPMRVFSEIRTGVKPEINALSTLLIVLVTAVAVTSSLMTKRAAKRQQQLLAATA